MKLDHLSHGRLPVWRALNSRVPVVCDHYMSETGHNLLRPYPRNSPRAGYTRLTYPSVALLATETSPAGRCMEHAEPCSVGNTAGRRLHHAGEGAVSAVVVACVGVRSWLANQIPQVGRGQIAGLQKSAVKICGRHGVEDSSAPSPNMPTRKRPSRPCERLPVRPSARSMTGCPDARRHPTASCCGCSARSVEIEWFAGAPSPGFLVAPQREASDHPGGRHEVAQPPLSTSIEATADRPLGHFGNTRPAQAGSSRGDRSPDLIHSGDGLGIHQPRSIRTVASVLAAQGRARSRVTCPAVTRFVIPQRRLVRLARPPAVAYRGDPRRQSGEAEHSSRLVPSSNPERRSANPATAQANAGLRGAASASASLSAVYLVPADPAAVEGARVARASGVFF